MPAADTAVLAEATVNHLDAARQWFNGFTCCLGDTI